MLRHHGAGGSKKNFKSVKDLPNFPSLRLLAGQILMATSTYFTDYANSENWQMLEAMLVLLSKGELMQWAAGRVAEGLVKSLVRIWAGKTTARSVSKTIYTRMELRRCKITLETSGEDVNMKTTLETSVEYSRLVLLVLCVCITLGSTA